MGLIGQEMFGEKSYVKSRNQRAKITLDTNLRQKNMCTYQFGHFGQL